MPSPERIARIRLAGASTGLLGSLVVHALLVGLVHVLGSAPDLGIELQLPDEIEFGLTEATELSGPIAAPEPSAVPEPVAEPEAAEVSEPEVKADKEPELERADAGTASVDAGLPTPDGGLEPTDAGTSPDAGRRAPSDAGLLAASGATPDGGLSGADAGPPVLAAYAPEGAQLALRLHMGRVRASPLAPQVRSLLEVIPDWRALLDGSGIDGIDDLERLFLASPNLKRSSLVVAGQYIGDESVPRTAVDNLARARGVEAAWSTRGGIPLAPWANADNTERIVALIGPRLFAISRPDDLPRILQVAHALAERMQVPDAGPVGAADALLALHDGETLAFSVEGARRFVARLRSDLHGVVPERLELKVGETGTGRVRFEAIGFYESAASARQAIRSWRVERDRLTDDPFVAFGGLRKPLLDMRFSTQQEEVRVRGTITQRQARLVLGMLRDEIRARLR
ncbi:MAG: hypothetical protein OXT09_01620 [Myxococcales bacterium]|nr:hypothetical protein [Myxococcales bacterium]